MRTHLTWVHVSLLCVTIGACSSGGDSTSSDDTSTGGSGQGGNPAAGAGGSAMTSGAGATGRSGAGGGGGAGGGSAVGGSASTGQAGSSSMNGGSGSTALTGTLGALGAVQPTVSSLVISNSGETLVYLSSAPITCELLTMSRWLGSVATGSQVIEIVVPSKRAMGTVPVEQGGAEVNYAPGGMSSAYEKNAASGSVTFTTSTPNGVVEGSVTASYANPTGNVSGTFHAEFCAGGQDY